MIFVWFGRKYNILHNNDFSYEKNFDFPNWEYDLKSIKSEFDSLKKNAVGIMSTFYSSDKRQVIEFELIIPSLDKSLIAVSLNIIYSYIVCLVMHHVINLCIYIWMIEIII